MLQQVKIVKVVSTVNKNTFCQFICVYSSLLARTRPNSYIKFRFANISKALLTNFSSLPKLNIRVDLHDPIFKKLEDISPNHPLF